MTVNEQCKYCYLIEGISVLFFDGNNYCNLKHKQITEIQKVKNRKVETNCNRCKKFIKE